MRVVVVVVGVVGALPGELPVAVVGRRRRLAVHGPEEPQDEHDGAEHHAAQGEGLQAALGRGEEGRGAPRHDEEDPYEDGPVVERRHRGSSDGARRRVMTPAAGTCCQCCTKPLKVFKAVQEQVVVSGVMSAPDAWSASIRITRPSGAPTRHSMYIKICRQRLKLRFKVIEYK